MIEHGLKLGFLAPAGTLEKKPPHGQPCNRCGLCCVATLCPLGSHVFKQKMGPCPALSYDADGSVCGLVATPAKFAMRVTLQHGVEAVQRAARQLIGSATGCDARFNGETPDESFYSRLREHDRRTKGKTNRAIKLWGLMK